MKELIFMWMLWTGQVAPQEMVDNRQTYVIFFEDNTVIEYAYEEEVLNWIETGEFKYDEALDCGEDGSKCQTHHYCEDETHETCDGGCICDGLGCIY